MSISTRFRGLRSQPYLILSCVLSGLFAVVLPAAAQWQGFAPAVNNAVGETIPNEIIVSVDPQADSSDKPLAFAEIGSVLHHAERVHAYRLKLRPGSSAASAIARLRLRKEVTFAEPNHRVHVTAEVNDPFHIMQWGLARMSCYSYWGIWQPRASAQKPIILAIVDTGVDGTHEDLTNVMYRDAQGHIIGYDANTHQTGDAPFGTWDEGWHGTHCAGIAAAQANNGIGIAGVAGWNGVPAAATASFVKIMPVRVFDNNGYADDLTLAEGIQWAADSGANVISLSVGDTQYSYSLDLTIQGVWNQGCVVVAAAGNARSTAHFYPAFAPNDPRLAPDDPANPPKATVISVAACTNTNPDIIAGYSNYGSWVTMAAPGGDGSGGGGDILSTLPGNQYGYKGGTSMACPHVAGEAALLFAQNPELTNVQVRNFILNNLDPFGIRYDSVTGLPFGTPQASVISPTGGVADPYHALTKVIAAMPSVSGTVNLSGSLNSAQTLNFRFKSLDGKIDFTTTAALTPTAAGASTARFAIPALPATRYNLAVTGSRWLLKTLAVNLSVGTASLPSITLIPGDTNGDNIVNFDDFLTLINAWGSTASVPGSGYDASADLNCDGIVDFDDFTLLLGNYGLHGDPQP